MLVSLLPNRGGRDSGPTVIEPDLSSDEYCYGAMDHVAHGRVDTSW